MATPRWPRSAVAALAILVLVAACGAPAATPTPAQKAFDAANATAQAVVEATTLARQAAPAAKPTAAATPSAAATLGRVRVWLLAADPVDQLGDRRPDPGQQLVRVEVAVEHAEPRALTVDQAALLGGEPRGDQDPALGFQLVTADGARTAPLAGLGPALPPVLLPPGYRLPGTLLFIVPAAAAPAKLVVRGVRVATGQAELDLAAAGKGLPPMPATRPLAPKKVGDLLEIQGELSFSLVQAAMRDGRLRVRVEVGNPFASLGLTLDPARVVAAEAVGASGDLHPLQPDGPLPAPPAAGDKASWELVDKPVAAGSWYDARPFRPVQVLVALKSPRREDQLEVASYLIAPEDLDPPPPTAGAVRTLAGSTLPGYADGAGPAAAFNGPVDVVVDPSGALYVADSHNHRIRKVSPTGDVTTFAGGVTAGASFVDAVGTAARFWEPRGLALDSAGFLYVGDSNNNRVRKIAPDATVTTLAGASAFGLVDGPGPDARFRYPKGVAVDPAGNVYLADKDNNRVRKVAPDGSTTTALGSGVAGAADGPALQAELHFPEAVALDKAGNLYVADAGNHRIRKLAPDGSVTTLAGTTAGYADGPGAKARFDTPRGLTVDPAGNVFVADAGNNRIRKIAPDGTVSTVAGGDKGFADGPAAQARFAEPFGVALDAAGNLYVADSGNNRIRKITGPL